ncbi:MAG: phosphoribosylglycinamide formyltransferase [Fimbriimonadaceae bacterium]|jgi:formyltetrahydrofolate-dependent phosphoribosylglycinamide formyltransferase|nr:phosphoribosylglycinamide formyltransferase [Fimbriimonadaceae bacterium]
MIPAETPKKLRLAILVGSKGRGSNLMNLLEASAAGEIPAEVSLVVSPVADNPASLFAHEKGVAVQVLSPKTEDYDSKLLDTLMEHKVDLVCLAGYMTLLPNIIVRRYSGKILNIHPALLPKFGGKGMYGVKVHEAVIEGKERESGATVHWVTERYDEGEIVIQIRCSVEPDDTPETLSQRVLACEHLAYRQAIRMVAGYD